MHFFRRRLRSFTWVALFAIFGLALAPMVSHALAGHGSGFNPWAEICSAAGATVNATAAAATAPDDGASSNKAAAALHLDHCPLCGGAAQAPVLPPSATEPLPAPDGADYLPALFAHSPRPLFAWAAAQPRGPPSVS